MGELTWYIVPAIVLTVFAVIICVIGFWSMLDDGVFEYGGPDIEDWIAIAILSSLPFLAWLWPLVVGLIALAVVLAVLALPFVGMYAGLRAYRAWKEEE